jgi:hypothetical protein
MFSGKKESKKDEWSFIALIYSIEVKKIQLYNSKFLK